jgi:hypothetical protein
MCLTIRKKTKRNEMKSKYLLENKPNAQGFIVGYKLFKRYEQLLTFFHEGRVFQEDNVFSGLVKSNRISKKITDDEEELGQIYKGCHFFLTLKDAKHELRFYSIQQDKVIHKIYFKPEDLVAIGQYNKWCDSGVVMQYILK